MAALFFPRISATLSTVDHPKILKRIVRLGIDIISGLDYGTGEQWPEIARRLD
jgi:2-iminoacetate synthase ThiH